MELLHIKRALLSVTDKSGLVEFASFLAENDVELISTGGTKKALEESGLTVGSVSDVTGFPEIMDGRVKTLHPHIHAAVLADKDNPGHVKVLSDLNLRAFDLICVNLYNFNKALSENMPPKQAVEYIDIGGPTLLRAAAKNYHSVLVVPDTSDYPRVRADLLDNDMRCSLKLRERTAAKTFTIVSRYDSMIARYLTELDDDSEMFEGF